MADEIAINNLPVLTNPQGVVQVPALYGGNLYLTQLYPLPVGQIEAGSISGSSITNQSLPGSAIMPSSIPGTAIVDSSIGTSQLAQASVTASILAPNSVGTTALAPGSVTAAAIATGAISSSSISDDSILGKSLQDATVTGTKIANGTITYANIATGTIQDTNISTELWNSATFAAAVAAAVVGGIASGTSSSQDVSFVPITQGFGTISGAYFYWRRLGDSMTLRGTFTTGTVTSSATIVGLPNSLTISAPKMGATSVVGIMYQNGTAASCSVLATGGNGYVQFGQFGSTNVSPGTGTSFSSSALCSFTCTIPISGWTNNN